MKSSASYQKRISEQAGLTLIEMMVVLGIIGTLFGIATVSIMNIRVIATNNTSTSVIVSDLKNQQIKAIAGDTEGRGTPDNYGMKILPNSYVLFHGNSYNSSDVSNFVVPVESGFTLSTTFLSATLLFASQSGELVSFVQNQDSITITNTSSSQTKTIQLNKYGTITGIN